MYSCTDLLAEGLPHSDIHGSKPARGSPWLFAACHVLHRLLMPRHPPNALIALNDQAVSCQLSVVRDNLRRELTAPPCTEAKHALSVVSFQESVVRETLMTED